jgi:hypothetical protein
MQISIKDAVINTMSQLVAQLKEGHPLEYISSVLNIPISSLQADIITLHDKGLISSEIAVQYGVQVKQGPPAEQCYIYVLALQEHKYYVGQTHNMDACLELHQPREARYDLSLRPNQRRTASTWTEKYPMVELVESFIGEPWDEDKTVIKYMSIYGIDNVRGGSYSQIDLSFEQHISLRRQIFHAQNKCIACGLQDHWIANCQTEICYKCGRVGHNYNNCLAITHSHGGKLDGCTRCGRPDHWRIRCNRSKDCYGRTLEANSCAVM